MTYYKIVRNGIVTDAGFVFLAWNEKHHRMMACDIEEAQYIQSFNQENVYHAAWLKPAPPEAGIHETVEAVAINATEFDEIRALLDSGEPVPNEPEPPEEPEEQPQEPNPVEPERPMTVGEMRQLIIEQQERIDLLEGCLLEMSEIVYGE